MVANPVGRVAHLLFGNFVDNVHRGTSVTDGSGISKLLGMDVPYMKNQGLQYTVQGGLQAQMRK